MVPYRRLYTWLLQAEHEEDKAAKKRPPLLARDGGMGAECGPVTGSPHSHSTLMTHAAAEGLSDWSAKWNKHGFGAGRAPIGRCGRPSIQTGLRRRAANCGSGSRIWTARTERQRRVSLRFFTCYLSHSLPRKSAMISESHIHYV